MRPHDLGRDHEWQAHEGAHLDPARPCPLALVEEAREIVGRNVRAGADDREAHGVASDGAQLHADAPTRG